MNISRNVVLLLSIAITAFTTEQSARAQTNVSASITVSFEDASGASVPGVHVVLTNDGTSVERQSSGDERGTATISLLPPGKYTLKAEKAAFKPIVISQITLEVSDHLALKVHMQVGDVQSSIAVVADALLLQSESGSVSLVVNERRISDLPLNGKNFQILTILTPGVGSIGAFNNPSVSGTRFSANTFTVDGADTSDERTPQGVASYSGAAGFATGYAGAPSVIPVESLREFRVVGADSDATFGRGSGAQIDMVTKSGTSKFHGAGYEYLRNNALDARDFFNRGPFLDTQGHARVPPFRYNLFGASLGGPIVLPRLGHPIGGKHFFFFNYEGYRQRLQAQTNVSAVVPNADLMSLIPGDLGKLYRTYYVDRGIVPATGNPAGSFVPLAANSAAAAPYIAAGFNPALFDGNLANGEAGTVLLNVRPLSNVNQNAIVARTDHRWNDRWSSSFRFIGNRSGQLSNPTTGLQADLARGTQHWYDGVASLTYEASPAQIIEIRGAVQRSEYQTGSAGGTDPRLVAIGVSGAYGLSVTSTATGLSALSVSPGAGFLDNQSVPQLSILHTYVRGRLTLRSGADVRWIQANVANYSGTTPAYTFAGFLGTNGLLGTQSTQAQAIAASARATSLFGVNGGPTTALRGWRSAAQEYFTQADWRVRRDLTVTLGLRYSYTGVYHEANKAMSNLYAVDSSGAIHDDVSPFAYGRFSYQIGLTNAHPFYQPDRNNFAPRLGIAWDIAGRGKTVIRAGFGTYFDRISQIDFTADITNAPLVVTGTGANVAYRLGSGVPAGTAPIDFVAMNPAIRNPYTNQFNFTIEQKLDSGTSVSASYVGTRGRSLIRALEPNGGASVPTANRPDPRFGRLRVISNSSSSNYNALQILIKRRLFQGLDFTVAYTYAKSYDDFSFDYLTAPPSLINLGANPNAPGFSGGGTQFVDRPHTADWGPSSFDIRHNLTFSHIYELPFGRNRKFGSSMPAWLNTIAGDYSLAGLFIFRKGDPFTATWGSDIYQVGDTAQARPALVQGTLADLYANGSEPTQYLLAQAAARTRLAIPNPVSNPFQAIGRNSLSSPSFFDYDLSLRKTFVVRENLRLSFEGSAFNVFNHPNFAAPVAVLSDIRFGQIVASRAGSSPRQLQLGVRLAF